MKVNLLGCGLVALSLVLGACSVNDKNKITKLTYQICFERDDCQEVTSENIYWGDVKDIKVMAVPPNPIYKGLVMVKSRGCIGWHDEPQDVNYFWELSGIPANSALDINDIKVKILEKEVVPKNKYEEVIEKATIDAINTRQSSFSMASCYSKDEIASQN